MSSSCNKSKKDDNADKATTPCRGRSTTPGRRTPSANADTRESDTYEDKQIPNQEEPEQAGERIKSPEPEEISLDSLSIQTNSPEPLKIDPNVQATVADPTGELLVPQHLDTIQLSNPNTSIPPEVVKNFCANCTKNVTHKRTNNTSSSKDKEKRSNYKDKQSAKMEAISSYYRRKSTVREMAAKSANPKPYYRDNRDRQPQRSTKQDYQVSYGSSTTRYCAACGQNSHKISDGCRLLCDDKGRQYPTALTSAYCTNCYRKYSKELHHSRHLCPGRPAMMELYHSGKVKPGGVFRQTYEEWANAKTNGSSKDCNSTSRVNAITAKITPNDPKILTGDNSATTMEENRKMYLNCSGCMPDEVDCKYDYDVHMTALVDSATDRNIMAASYFSMLFGVQSHDVKNQLEKSDMTLVRYTEQKIPVAGEITLMIRPTPFSGSHQPVLFLIVPEEHKNVTPMIIGMNGIRDLQLGWTSIADNHPSAPYLYSAFHPGGALNSIFCSDYELQLCTGIVEKIDAKETQTIAMNINHFFNLAPGTQVILSDDHIAKDRNAGIKILPGQTQLTINDSGQLSGRALITNNSNHTITNTVIIGYMEPSDQSVVRKVVVDFDFTGSFIYGVPVPTELDEIEEELEQLATTSNTPAIN